MTPTPGEWSAVSLTPHLICATNHKASGLCLVSRQLSGDLAHLIGMREQPWTEPVMSRQCSAVTTVEDLPNGRPHS